MIVDEDRIGSLRALCPEAAHKFEGGNDYVYLPKLRLSVGGVARELDALLRLNSEGNYLTRLYLSEQIAERPTIGDKPANWTQVTILGRSWFTWSWANVSGEASLIQVLTDHLKALE